MYKNMRDITIFGCKWENKTNKHMVTLKCVVSTGQGVAEKINPICCRRTCAFIIVFYLQIIKT